MINLNRSKENKWIMQKNVNSREQISAFLLALNDQKCQLNNTLIKDKLKESETYKGRSTRGSSNTMGVRLSQMSFYMFGYKESLNSKFIPSPMMQIMIDNKDDTEIVALINLFSMQYPHPYSETKSNFHIYIGRFLLTLLLDERISKRLYIDELIWFIPFIETINENSYVELINSILEYRKLSFFEKKELFESIEDFNNVFSNCTHEMKYYFLNIFSDFGVFKVKGDKHHNGGNLFRFRHGKSDTFRNDAYGSRKQYSGYFEISPNLIENATKLVEKFSCFELPETQATSITKSEWIRDLYEFEPLKYISHLKTVVQNKNNLVDIIKDMLYSSKYGSKDGRAFEYSLSRLFELFRETRNVEIISGSGDTDILCVMYDDNEDTPYKINVDAKTAIKATQSLNARRLSTHIKINGSKYCIVVSPRFSKGAKLDIYGHRIVTIEAEALANYCLKECFSSTDNLANFTAIDNLIDDNFGKDITNNINHIIARKYGIEEAV